MIPKIVKLGTVIISLIAITLAIKFAFAPTSYDKEQVVKTTTESQSTTTLYNKKMKISEHDFNVQISKSNIEKQQGLSDRESMQENEGMLFDMTNEQNSKVAFWMKDMKFDLDLIWIKDFIIQEITKNVPAFIEGTTQQNLELYSPQNSIDMVLELNAGVSEKLNIKVGDKIIIK